jgi:hypothetical protein
MGAYSRENVFDLMNSVDWVVVPSVWPETFGLVVSEAWEARRPILASRAGGLIERIEDRKNGLSFAPGSVSGLAQLMTECIGNARVVGVTISAQVEDEISLDLAWSPPCRACKIAHDVGTRAAGLRSRWPDERKAARMTTILYILGSTRSGTSALRNAIAGTRYKGYGEGHLVPILSEIIASVRRNGQIRSGRQCAGQRPVRPKAGCGRLMIRALVAGYEQLSRRPAKGDAHRRQDPDHRADPRRARSRPPITAMPNSSIAPAVISTTSSPRRRNSPIRRWRFTPRNGRIAIRRGSSCPAGALTDQGQDFLEINFLRHGGEDPAGGRHQNRGVSGT